MYMVCFFFYFFWFSFCLEKKNKNYRLYVDGYFFEIKFFFYLGENE